MFDVLLSPFADRFFNDAERPLRKRLERCFQQLRLDPYRHNNIKRLTGQLSLNALRQKLGTQSNEVSKFANGEQALEKERKLYGPSYDRVDGTV
jgi:hypothetical protein